MKTSRHLIFFLLQFICFSAISQERQIRFDHLGTDQGLSQSNVLCILQDSRGFMWFGTREGLNKYDGYKFTVYKNDVRDPHSIGNNYIRSITESRDGSIWVATTGGLCMFDRFKNRFVNFKHDPKNKYSISNDFVLSVMEDHLGNIWAGTQNGLNMLDRKTSQFTRYSHRKDDSTSLAYVLVKNIFEDSDHVLWICTAEGGLQRFNTTTKTFTRFQHNEKDNKSISSNNVNTMFEDSKHRLWVGTNDGGLDLFNKESGFFFHFKHDENNHNSLAANSVFSINQGNDNNLWIGTENGGLSIFNPETGKFYTYQNDVVDNTSLSSNSIYAICKDTKNNIWLGTFNAGVDMVNPDAQKFAHYKHIVNKNSLSNNNVLCIYEDSRKNIWIGTDGGGLNLFDPQTGQFTYFDHEKNNKNSICGHYVLTVCEDSKGNIWVGTWADGITVMNRAKGTFKHYKNDPDDPSSLSSNNAWKIFEDKDKNIWIGTYRGGLNLFNPVTNSFTRYQHEENNRASISSNNTQSILEDSEGKLWITTDDGGVNLFDKKTKTFSHLLHDDKKNSIMNNSAGSIYEDRNKNLWIGTMAGLSCLDKKTGRFVNYTTLDGLPNNVIFGILEDQQGNLWVSTSKGISKFDPVNKVFKNFGVSDGLQGNEFKQQAYCKSSNGTIYFGGNNGFNQFIPENIKSNSFSPPLVITGIQILNKDVPVSNDSIISPLKNNITETSALTLSYKSSVISFEFASLNYTSPEKKQYAYMLEGFDKTWNEVGTKRTATYTNLDAGEYTFKVKGLNNDGSWSDNIKSIQLTITPPFWLTWWFKSIVILFILGCFFAFYRLRMKAVTNQKIQLEKQIKERTEEVVLQKEAFLAAKEQASIESNTRLSYAAQATSDAIWDRNYAENEVFWGDGYRTLFGYDITPETTTASFWSSKVHPEDIDEIKKITQKAKDDSRANSWSCEYRFLKANGEYAFVKEKAIILRDKNGIPERTIGALQDITEIKQRELILKEVNNRLEQEKYYLDTLMDNMPDAIYFKDKESRFVRVSAYMVNKHLANHPGASINDLLGKTDFDLQDEKHAKEAYEDEQEIQRTKKPKIDYIEKEITEDGLERWVATTKLAMMNHQGEVIGTFGISRDITKIKTLEKEHHESQLNQAIAQSKFEIASEVMHDIGNAVVGFGSYLTRVKRLQENSCGENLKNLVAFFEEQKELLATAIGQNKTDAVINMLTGIERTQHKTEQEILKSVTEQQSIIANVEEILSIQRKYVSGYESKERKPADLKSIINDTLSMLSTPIDENAIDISLKITDNLPPIKGDRTKLMQMILNIIKNSIDATLENTIQKHICISAYTSANKLILQIKDNGKGFDGEVANNLFSRGFSTKLNSTGNGLYNCKTIIESHEGTIDIISEGPGKGALATIGFKILAA